jgi:transcription antitermination factor NusG
VLKWYALKVRTRPEDIAAMALRNRGYEPFSPTYPERRKYTDRMKVVETAVFPGYIFCRFNAQRNVPVLSSSAVEYIVGVAGDPISLADSDIEAIRRTVESGGRPTPYLKMGRRVRIEFGPLAGLEGLLTHSNGNEYLTVSVDLLQRSVTVRIEADHVRLL